MKNSDYEKKRWKHSQHPNYRQPRLTPLVYNNGKPANFHFYKTPTDKQMFCFLFSVNLLVPIEILIVLNIVLPSQALETYIDQMNMNSNNEPPLLPEHQ